MSKSLVSPMISVNIKDVPFKIPAIATCVPTFFIATRKNKTVSPTSSIIAEGTTESGVVRTVTSFSEAMSLYGYPYFWKDGLGNEMHGDCRNEYGLIALYKFLEQGNRAYVVRADVDLTDASEEFMGFGEPVVYDFSYVGVGTGLVSNVSVVSELTIPQTFQLVFGQFTDPSDSVVKTGYSVVGSVSGFVGIGFVGTQYTLNIPTCHLSLMVSEDPLAPSAGHYKFETDDYITFKVESAPATRPVNGNLKSRVRNLTALSGAVAELWTLTFTSATQYTVSGSVSGSQGSGTIGTPYSNSKISFLIEGADTLINGVQALPFEIGDQFTIQVSQYERHNPLGANDAVKRQTIVRALQSEIITNQNIRGSKYNYTLLSCPGYHEVVDELVSLATDQSCNKGEVFIVADVPCDKTPAQAAYWAKTSSRIHQQEVAYYYPWGLTSNLDGRNVVIPPSAIAMNVIAYNDNVGFVWTAPAGWERGLVRVATSVGYVSGELGLPTTFVEMALNDGQCDMLYEGTAAVNPIKLDDSGIAIIGQKTSIAVANELDRINIMRLVMKMKRDIRFALKPVLMRPLDSITFREVKSLLQNYCNNILSNRGLYDFLIYCDETNNTAYTINNNELHVEVAIKPIKTAEFIYADISVVRTYDSF